jgi:hypothetical protein
VGHGDEGRAHNPLRVPFHPIADEWTLRSLGPGPSHTVAAEYPNQMGSD